MGMRRAKRHSVRMHLRSCLGRRAPPCREGPTAIAIVVVAAALFGVAGPAVARADPHVGRKQVGTASVYARKLAGRKMADGAHLDPSAPVAASKTLPLGTEAKVTNLKTGRSTRVTIEDRGPYVKGRIVDLSPAAAAQIGITPKEGVAKVEVAPVREPPRSERRAD